MKLLLPVDGSPASYKAAVTAASIAKKEGCLVKIITVIRPEELQTYKRNAKLFQHADGSIIDRDTPPITEETVFGKLSRNANAFIEDIREKAGFNGTPSETSVLIGEPHEVILKTAKDEAFDLIVMGNRGFSKVKRFFVGSVAQKVISEAPCPVLVIHFDAEK